MTKLVVALTVAGGTIIGVVVTSVTQIFIKWYEESPKRKANEGRKKLLLKMLNDSDHTWRKIETLQRVVGADEETTKRLLIELGARGSEKEKDVWGLISRNPFTKDQ